MALESSALDDLDDLETSENELSNPEPIIPPAKAVAQPGNGSVGSVESVESGADAPAPLSTPVPVPVESGHTSNNGDRPDGSPDAGDDYASTLWNSGAQRAFSMARGSVEQRARTTVAGIFDGDNNFGIIGAAFSAFKSAVDGGASAPADANAGGTADGGMAPAAMLPAAAHAQEGTRVRSPGAGNGSGTAGADDTNSPVPAAAADALVHPVLNNDGIGSLMMRAGLGIALPLAANGRIQTLVTDLVHGASSLSPNGSPPEGGDGAQFRQGAKRHPLNNTAEEVNGPLAGLQSTLPTINPLGSLIEPPRINNTHPVKPPAEGGDVGNGSPIAPDTAQQLARAVAGVFTFQGQLANFVELNARNLNQNGTGSESDDETLKKQLQAAGRHASDNVNNTANAVAGAGSDAGVLQTLFTRILNPFGSLSPGEPPAPPKVNASLAPSPTHPIGSGTESGTVIPTALPVIRRATSDVSNFGDGSAVNLANTMVNAGGRTADLTAGDTLKRLLTTPEPASDAGGNGSGLGSPVAQTRFPPDLQNFFRNFVQHSTDAEPAKELRRVVEDNGTPVEVNRFQNALRTLLQLDADQNLTNLPKVDHPIRLPADTTPFQGLINQLLPRTADRPSTELPGSASLTAPLLTNMAALLARPSERSPAGSSDDSGHLVLPRPDGNPARLLDLIAPTNGSPRDNDQNDPSLIRMLVAAMSASTVRSEALPGAIKLSTSLLARESGDSTTFAGVGVGIKITDGGRLLFEPAKPGSEIVRVSTGEIGRLLQSIELAGRAGEMGKLSNAELVKLVQLLDGRNGQVTIGRFIGLIDAGKPCENTALPGLESRFTAGLDGRSTRGGHQISGLEAQVDKSGRLIISELITTKGIGVVVASGIELGDKRSPAGRTEGKMPLSEITGVRTTSEAVSGGITITIGKEFAGEKGIRGTGRKKDPDEEEDEEATDSGSNGGLGYFGTTANSTSQTDPQNQTGTGVDPQTQINISQIDPNSILPGVTIVMGGPSTDPTVAQPCHTPAPSPDNNAQLDAALSAITSPVDEVRLSWRDGDRFNPDNTTTDTAVHADDLGPIASAMPASQPVNPIENQSPATYVQPAENIAPQPIQWKQQADPYIAAPDITDPFDMRLDTERKVPDCRIDLKDEKEDELERLRCWKEREAKRVMDTLAADQATRKNQRLFVDEEVRTRYIVRSGDTLESIAQRILHDGRLALLVFRINRSVIRVEYRDNKQIIHLKPNTVLQMPTRMEIEIFRATLGSKRLSDTKEALDVTTRINYTVRLGDNLRTVATKHPALKDATLWPLIAEINGLSTDANSEGSPSVRIQRGTTLRLPSKNEIAEFRARKQNAISDAV